MSRSFEIQPIARWAGRCAPMKRPKEIAYFSYDDNHEFHLDESSIRYYYAPKIGADLCKGFEKFDKLDDSANDHLHSLLKTIIDLEQRTGEKVGADIITWRGMMTKLLATPFQDRDGFEMNATLYQGTIFIEENHEYKIKTQSNQRSRVSAPGRPSQDMMTYWGYKFETLCLLPATWDETPRDYIEGREDMAVSNKAQYCSIVRTGIGNTTMVIGGEVDAVWDTKPPPPATNINWVELKTTVIPSSDRDMLNLERKLMKFWLQSFLLGVPKIIIGYRDHQGILRRIEEMETANIPGNVKRNGKKSWDGNVCINFGATFLDYLKQTIISDGVYRIRRPERSPIIEVFQIEEAGHGDILSDEFINWRIKLSMLPEKTVEPVYEAEPEPDDFPPAPMEPIGEGAIPKSAATTEQ